MELGRVAEGAERTSTLTVGDAGLRTDQRPFTNAL